jgi:hypothetical protein
MRHICMAYGGSAPFWNTTLFRSPSQTTSPVVTARLLSVHLQIFGAARNRSRSREFGALAIAHNCHLMRFAGVREAGLDLKARSSCRRRFFPDGSPGTPPHK